jgi:hypothetical protein
MLVGPPLRSNIEGVIVRARRAGNSERFVRTRSHCRVFKHMKLRGQQSLPLGDRCGSMDEVPVRSHLDGGHLGVLREPAEHRVRALMVGDQLADLVVGEPVLVELRAGSASAEELVFKHVQIALLDGDDYLVGEIGRDAVLATEEEAVAPVHLLDDLH